MAYFVFRTVKQIWLEPGTTPKAGLAPFNENIQYMLAANEYVLELEDDVSPEILDYIASVLTAAERCLMLRAFPVFVTIWPLKLGEKITLETPMKVCFRTDETPYTNNSTFYPIVRYERKSLSWLRSYESHRVKPLLVGTSVYVNDNPYNRSYCVDPFIGVVVSRDCVTGNAHQMCYKGCLDPEDYYWSPAGKLHLVENSNFVRQRFPDFESTMSLLYPVFSSAYLDGEGYLRQGKPTFSKLQLTCATDLRAARRKFRNSIAVRARMMYLLDSMLQVTGIFFQQAEKKATERKDLFVFTNGTSGETHPFFSVLNLFFVIFVNWKSQVWNNCKGGAMPAKSYRNGTQFAGNYQARPFVSTEFAQMAEGIIYIIEQYAAFVHTLAWPTYTSWDANQYKTSPHAPREAAPSGANYPLPNEFDQDKWLVATTSGATDIAQNWERYFRVLETSFNIIALVERFMAHLEPTVPAKPPRFYHRAVATRDPIRPYEEAQYLIPSRAVSGLQEPTAVPNNIRPDVNTEFKRCIHPGGPRLNPSGAFWMPKMRSLVLDRSGYDARLRVWLTATERATLFPRPQDRPPKPTETANGNDPRPPKNQDISQTPRNCDDLRINVNVKTIVGSEYDYSLTVPKPLVNGWKKLVGDNAYLTSDCSQRKPLATTLPVNPFAVADVNTSP